MNNFIELQEVSDEIGVDFIHVLKECINLNIPIIIDVSEYEAIITGLTVNSGYHIEQFNMNRNTHSQFLQFSRWSGVELVSENNWLGSEYALYGHWVLSNNYINHCLRNRLQPFVKVSSLTPYCENEILPIGCNSGDIIDIPPVLSIEKEKKEKIVEFYLDGGFQKVKRKYSYFSQSNAQKERHAAKRESVLMAAIALYKKTPEVCSKNAKQWGELLWSRKEEFWEDGKAPLSEEEIIKLLRRALKFGCD